MGLGKDHYIHLIAFASWSALEFGDSGHLEEALEQQLAVKSGEGGNGGYHRERPFSGMPR